jgi:hypothetical protein
MREQGDNAAGGQRCAKKEWPEGGTPQLRLQGPSSHLPRRTDVQEAAQPLIASLNSIRACSDDGQPKGDRAGRASEEPRCGQGVANTHR